MTNGTTQDDDRPQIDRARAELANDGILSVGLNYGNFLLVLGDDAVGQPRGIAPDIARELGRLLGVRVDFKRYELPGDLADAVRDGIVRLGFLGFEPQRASQLDFSEAYLEIEASYMVLAESGIVALSDVDRPGVRIAVVDRSAYDLWLMRNVRHASLLRVDSLAASYRALYENQAEVVAGLKLGLLGEIERHPGVRLIEESFTSVRQAICIPKNLAQSCAFLERFIADIKASQVVAKLIRTHAVGGVRVAS
jgi:polar amino acid transport system substrate-binding protein